MADDKTATQQVQTASNGQTEAPKAGKAKADYGKLYERAFIQLTGLQVLTTNAERELNRLLGDHPKAAQIRQLFKRAAARYGQMEEARADVARYERLAAENGQTLNGEEIGDGDGE